MNAHAIVSFLMPYLSIQTGVALAAALFVILLLAAMRPRRYYFVRHGETLMNAKHIRQGEVGGLSEEGKAQADRAGRYLAQFPIDRLFSSPYERTRETAAIIDRYLKVPIRYTRLLAERRNPSEIIGRNDRDPSIASIVDVMDKAYHDDAYRYSDEENFMDLRRRAHTCLSYLARNGARENCVVTHHIFLEMLIAYLLYRERLHAADYAKLSFFNTASNASITICEWHPWKFLNRTHGWSVIAYNEQPPEE